jgi:fluoride exporter
VSLTVFLGVGLLGGLGSVARYLVDDFVSARESSVFPAGILAVNLLGAFLIGVLTGAAVDGDAGRLLATGLLGGFTTFSTWMLDSQRLHENGHRSAFWLNLAISLVVGLFAVWLGRKVGAVL